MKNPIKTLALTGLVALVSCAGDKLNSNHSKPRHNNLDTIPYLAESVAEFAKGFGDRSDATLDNFGRVKPKTVGSVYQWTVGEGKGTITVKYTENDDKASLANRLHIMHASGDFNIRDEGLDGFQKSLVQTSAGYKTNKIKEGDQAEFWQGTELVSYTNRDGAVINRNVDALNSKYKDILKLVLNK